MAKIGIDLDRRIGTVDRRIFDNFIEHLGRCIYGGLFEEGSPLSDDHGFRQDVLEAVRRLRIPILRWPGGNFVSADHWPDGVVPRRIESVRHGRVHPGPSRHRHRAVHLREPGIGPMDEAQAWVEYANSTGKRTGQTFGEGTDTQGPIAAP